MTETPTPNWQPLSMLPMLTSLIDAPLDDATVDRILRAYAQVLEMVDIYRQQLVRWGKDPAADAAARAEIERLAAALPELATLARTIVVGAEEIRIGTIDRIMEMDDVALGLAALTGKGFPRQR